MVKKIKIFPEINSLPYYFVQTHFLTLATKPDYLIRVIDFVQTYFLTLATKPDI